MHITPTKRQWWGKTLESLPELDLTKIQRDSFAKFLNVGVGEVLDEITPIEDFTGKNYSLRIGRYRLGQSKYTPEQALDRGVTYDAPLLVEAVLTNKQTGDEIKQEVFLCDLPLMLEKGTFIINGIERAVVNQLVRAPGVYYSGMIDPTSGKMLYQAEIRPLRGSWIEFAITKNDFLNVRIDRKRKFVATTFLRAIGLSTNDQIIKAFSFLENDEQKEILNNTLLKDATPNQEEALLEIYRRMRPGDPVVLDNAKTLVENMFFNPRRYSLGPVGRFKLDKKLRALKERIAQDLDGEVDLEHEQVLRISDFIATLAYLLGLPTGTGRVDDIDHLGNRRVRRVGELVQQNAFRTGILRLERVIKERMSLATADNPPTPTTLVNARPVISAVNEFFRSSQLSTILDQTNPLSEIDNLRRLSVMGTGGITRERAAFSIRDINNSQYSRVCPIRSPEGPNIGLVTYMALFTRVNEFGFLEAPYRRVIRDGKKVRVTDEIVFLSADDEEEHYVTHADVSLDENGYIKESHVPVRFHGEFLTVPSTLAEYIDVVPRQVVGTSASLIPFLAHDDANRALMGTHMQCQAVPLLLPAGPIVGTGMEQVVADNMNTVIRSPGDGEVVHVDGQKLIIKVKEDGKSKEITYTIKKFVRTPQSTCYSQTPVVDVGQKIKKGDLLIDGPATQNGDLALGQNLTIAYMSFDGLGYEDAIVISDRLVKDDVLSSIHIEEYETAVVDTKLGPEEMTRDIPNVGEEDLANLDENGIVVIGAEVGPNSILVGKIAPKGETELTAEERLLRAIFGEKAREVRDTSLKIPHGERGTVIDVKILSRENGDELEPGTIKKIIVKVAQMRKVVVGDKLAGRHGNKGVISKIVPSHDLPYLADGTPVDIIISPLSVLSRMNLGQLLETHLGWAAEKLGQKVALPVFEKVPEEMIISELEKVGLPVDGRSILYDGRTGEPFDRPIVVGKGYFMKLIHMVEDKTHARSTGPYSLITQQPLGGKAQMGGQRLGEMEVWALEAYGAAYTLQEMLTIKSDDVVGRAKAFEAIIKNAEIPQALIPESFKVLVKELNSLSINVQTIGAKIQEEPEIVVEEVSKEAKELAAESGAEEVLAADTSGMEIKDASELAADLPQESAGS